MKYAISLMLSFSAFAAPIKVFYEKQISDALMVKQILMADYKIPEDLIELGKVAECEALARKGKLDLCLKNNGDLLLVSVERGFVSESLKIFRAP